MAAVPEVSSVVEPVVSEPVVAVLAAVPEVSSVFEPEVFEPVVAALAAVPEVSSVVEPVVSEPEVVALAAVPEVLSVAVFEVAASVVVDLGAAGPEVAFVSERQASVDTAVAFVVLVLVSVVVGGVDSPGRPRFLAFPNSCCSARSSSSAEVVSEESVDSPTGDRTNHGLCSILSIPDLHQNKMLGHWNNNPSPDYNNVSDTNDLPRNATKNRPRNKGLRQCRVQRKHRPYQAALSPPVVQQTQGAADQY